MEVPIFNQSCFSSIITSQIVFAVVKVPEHRIAPKVQRLKDTFVWEAVIMYFLK